MSLLRRTGCLVLAMVAIANQVAHAEETASAPAAKPAAVPTPSAVPAPAAAPAAPPLATVGTAAAEDAFPLHGFFKSRYVARLTDGAGDQDLTETLSLDAGDPERNRVTAHVLGDVAIDLDGNTDTRGYHAFASARDSTSGDAAVPRLYSGYVDIHRVGPLAFIRVGRQSIYETPEISYFDGVRAETAELGSHRLRLGVYDGIPVHLYQGYALEDVVDGAYAAGHLWRGARARVDWQHLASRNSTAAFSNDILGVGAWQSLGRYLDLHAHYTRLDDQDRDVLARGTFSQPVWDLRFQASYYQQLQTTRNAVIEADAYYPILKAQVPYREYRCMASKGIGDHVDIDAGMDLRRLINGGQESTFNHQYDRFFATLDLCDLLVKGSDVSLTEEAWISPGRHTQSQAVDVTWPLSAKTKLSAGTAHYLYKYDLFSDSERDDVQDYYLKCVYKYSRVWRFTAEYDYEDDGSSFGHYHELRCEALCSF